MFTVDSIGRCHVEPDTIVLDRHEQRVRQTLQIDAARARLRMFGHVRERLLNNAVRRDFCFRLQPFGHSFRNQIDLNALTPGETFQIRVHSSSKSQVVEQRRVQQVRHVAHGVEDALRNRPCIVKHTVSATGD